MEENKDIQDVDLENNDEVLETEEEAPQSDARIKELEAEAAKWKRIAERNAKKADKPEATEETPVKKASSDLDYGQKAFLHAHGIKGADELELVKNWTGRTGDSLDQVVEDDIFLSKLTKLREAKATADALPKQGKRSTTQIADDVDYWMDKPFEDVPQKFKSEVLNRRVEREKGNNQFSSNPIVIG